MTTTKGHLAELPEAKKPELKLTIWPDECLQYAVAPFPEDQLNSPLVRNTAGGMIQAMYKHHGVGLAAQQVAVPFQVFVMDAYWVQPDKGKHPRVFLNPEITGVGDYMTELPHPGEGCLSFPYDFHGGVRRHDRVELQWLDFKGEVHHEWFDGYESIIVQHEMDHLTGHCFLDRLSQLKQGMGYRRARKMRRRYGSGMKAGMKMFKQMQKGPEALLDRQRNFEMKARKWLNAEDAADLALVKERLAESSETRPLEEVLDDIMDKNSQLYTALANPPAPNEKLKGAAIKFREAIEDGTLKTDSGDGEGPAPRHSSRYSAAAQRLVQREDARKDDKRMRLRGDGEDQEGDQRTESSGDSE